MIFMPALKIRPGGELTKRVLWCSVHKIIDLAPKRAIHPISRLGGLSNEQLDKEVP
jgi:hypothetical protein